LFSVRLKNNIMIHIWIEARIRSRCWLFWHIFSYTNTT